MSKIEEQIQQYCPDGVEYVKLGEVCEYSKDRIDALALDETNFVSVENLLQNRGGKTISSSVPATGKWTRFEKGHILIGNIRPYLKKIWLADRTGGTNGDVLCIKIKKELGTNISPSFLFQLLASDDFFTYDMNYAKGAKMPRGDKSAVLNYLIPIPPLPVQEEIVRILDTFSELQAELQKELEAELQARQQQYQFYRDKLFAFDDRTDIKYKKLSEVASIKTGRRFVRTDIKESGVPCFHYGDIYTYYGLTATKTKGYLDAELASKLRFAQPNDVVVVCAGENDMDLGIGVAWLGDEPAVVHDACCILHHEQNPRYISHFLRTHKYHLQMKRYAKNGKISSLSSKSLGEAIIPIPSLEEQERIATTLDRFDSLVNDLSKGLPAEIEARKQQYEYYRDRLLTFKKKA